LIAIYDIPAEEWVVIPIQARKETTVSIEVASSKSIDFGVVPDLKEWEESEEDDDFEREYWQEEFRGSHDFMLELEPRQRGYSLIFWNSNYSGGKVAVAYRITYGSPRI
jgi:hypothetical protein